MIKMKPHQISKDDFLSVIVPAYNCATILRDLQNIHHYLVELGHPFEIICVVDGQKSPKDHTYQKALKAKRENVKVYHYAINKGKGYAVRFGMAKAKGGIIAFIDAGSDLHVKGLGLALETLKWHHADIVIGSKRHPDSKVRYPWQRKVLSFLVQTATHSIFGLRVTDTQTGLKVFKRNVLEKVLPRLMVKRWAFDLEILSVAKRLGFDKIYESPVEINYNFASNIGYQSVINYFIDYLAIIYRTYILHYYDDCSKDQWRSDSKLVLKD